MRNLGIVLIVIGLSMTVITGFNIVTRKKVVDVGPVHVSTNKDNPIQWSPILGGIILVAGIVVFVSNKNRK
jgi:hypothetical protein